MCGSVVYRCTEIRCSRGNASVLCKVLIRGMYFIFASVSSFEWGLQREFCGISRFPNLTPCDYSFRGVLKDNVFAHFPINLAKLHAAIETEFETLRATPDFTHRVCYILCNRC